VQPILMPPNVIEHFYSGGARIAELRGTELASSHSPEDWLAATTDRADSPGVGQSRTEDGELLRDLIAVDPVGWIGSDAGAAGDNGILVKLIDAGQRLPVHVHPDRAFARSHLNCPYGKSEAWFVLATSGDKPSVWLGWTDDVDPEELSRRVDAQDSQWMFSRMNRVDVRPGDGIFVPAGTAHAIGEGVFLAEVQEPTDFSILLEWSVTTATREESHLGLGLPLALRATTHSALAAGDLAGLVRHTDLAGTSDVAQQILTAEAEPFFRVDLLAPDADSAPGVPAGFAVGIVFEGSGEIRSAGGDVVPARRGQVFAIPAGFGAWTVSGNIHFISCRPGAGWPQTLPADNPAAGRLS